MRAAIVVGAVLFSACVPYPGEAPYEPPPQAAHDGPFRLLDPGASQLDGLHFRVRAYGSDAASKVSEIAEAAYSRIMVDTNLFSFQPRGLYQIVLYGGQDEYRRKTGQPDWSGGVSVGNAIYTYAGPALERTLAHEMTHLIFFEYMGRAEPDHRWVNEGLAVFEENKAAGGLGGGPADIFATVRMGLRQQSIPMDQMIRLVPATERAYTVSLWYAEAESLVRFMVERGGRIGFSQFLAALKDGKSFDQAFSEGFPGSWRRLSDFELAWQRSLQ